MPRDTLGGQVSHWCFIDHLQRCIMKKVVDSVLLCVKSPNMKFESTINTHTEYTHDSGVGD